MDDGTRGPEVREEQSKLWLTVAEQLGIEVVAPLVMRLDDGADLRAAALIKNFGARNGMVVDPDWHTLSPVRTALFTGDYGYSAVNISGYALSAVVEILSDWGWTGAPDDYPAWLNRS
jgi:hypothetical protein